VYHPVNPMTAFRRRKENVMDYELRLRPVLPGDLPLFYGHHLDMAARLMVAFAAEVPEDYDAFQAKWAKNLADPATLIRTIEIDGEVAGNVSKFPQFDKPSIGYWLGRKFWGRKIATRAVQAFLLEIPARPLFARAAKDNAGSLRILAHCGFAIVGEDKGFAAARGQEIEEFILELQ
jgi:RimJ/RimL family protein N-acetyltransferase